MQTKHNYETIDQNQSMMMGRAVCNGSRSTVGSKFPVQQCCTKTIQPCILFMNTCIYILYIYQPAFLSSFYTAKAKAKALFKILKTVNTTTIATIFFEASILRFTLKPCLLISCNPTSPSHITQERKEHNTTFTVSLVPCTFFTSLRTSKYDQPLAPWLGSNRFRPTFSFTQPDRCTRTDASHAISSLEVGRFIQSPLYFISVPVWLPKHLGLNISSRD